MVISIAEMLPAGSGPDALWRLMRQAGVRHAVGSLPGHIHVFPGERPWDLAPLMRLQEQYHSYGFHLDVIESRPPLNLAKRGLEGRDAEIDAVCELLQNMGRLGIRTWCYEWMTDFNWLRTNLSVESRGGSFVSGYRHDLMQQAPESDLGPIGEEQLWETLGYFLRRVVPAAEEAGVRLAMHPDDPPVSPIRGVGRIMRSIDNYQRLLDLVPSPMNGITLCQGNFSLMTADLPAAIRQFTSQHKVFFVHLRDVRGPVTDFVETWHDDGPTDLLACLRAYHEGGFDGVLRPDHVPTVDGDVNDHPGYSRYGRLFAVGYIRGLLESVQGKGVADQSPLD